MAFLAPFLPALAPIVGGALGSLFGGGGQQAGQQVGQAVGGGLGAQQAAQQQQQQAWQNAQQASSMQNTQTSNYVNQLLDLYKTYKNPALGNVNVSGVSSPQITNVAGAAVPGQGYIPYQSTYVSPTAASGGAFASSPTSPTSSGTLPALGPANAQGSRFAAYPGGVGPNPSFTQNKAGLFDYNGNSGIGSEATNYYPTEQAAQAAWVQKYGSGP